MMLYEFYWNDEAGEAVLFGILPERRKDQLRITRESIMKWGKLAASSYVDPNCIYYIPVQLHEEL